TADVDANAGETITNGISVWGPDKNPDTEGPDDEDDTPEIPVVRVAELTIDKVADETRVQAGESSTVTLTITNTGPSILASGEVIALTERPGAGVTITGYEIASGGATIEGAGNAATVTSTEALGLGESIVVRVTANVAADAPATITNGVDVYGPGKNPGTDEPDDKDDTPEVPVDHNFALSITKVADEARVRAGESTSFTLTITNGGPATIPVGRTISLVERPGNGLSITGYEVTSGNGRAE